MTFTVARAPLRVSLFGGGTDRPEYYQRHGSGNVLSFAINKFMHVAINKVDNKALKVSYSQLETVNDLVDLKHDIVRETWRAHNLGMGWEIASFADLPTVGTGLGSSSSFAVALVKTLSRYDRDFYCIARNQIAEKACDIEMRLCGSPIGKQDQYAAAYGGVNWFSFDVNGKVERTGVIHESLIADAEEWMLLFYTGISRSTNEVLSKQVVNDTNYEILKQMEAQVAEGAIALSRLDMPKVGSLLHEAWELKRRLPNVTSQLINEIYNKAINAGAIGGKVLGAGGGGFMLFIAHSSKHAAIKEALGTLKHTPFHIEESGVQLLTANH